MFCGITESILGLAGGLNGLSSACVGSGLERAAQGEGCPGRVSRRNAKHTRAVVAYQPCQVWREGSVDVVCRKAALVAHYRSLKMRK